MDITRQKFAKMPLGHNATLTQTVQTTTYITNVIHATRQTRVRKVNVSGPVTHPQPLD